MTIRQMALDEALRAFSGAAAAHGLHPAQEVGSTRCGAISIGRVVFRDPAFSSPWWGHASGSQAGDAAMPRAALVGAYGEMIENVSCDYWYPDWLPCRREIAPLWDEQRVAIERCTETLPPGSGLRATMEAACPDSLHRVHPYVCLTGRRPALLFPREIGLEVVGRNNGAAVGSDRCEAIVAALFEIFERYALRKFALRTARFPLIDPRTFAGGWIEPVAAQLRAQGRELLYLDMSLGGRLPVVGVLLLDAAADRMSIAVAGGHRLEEAVGHCLREMLSDEYYGDRIAGWSTAAEPGSLLRAWSRSGFTVGWGGSLQQVELEGPCSRHIGPAFDLPARSGRDVLRACVEICRRFDSDVFVRDTSILGVAAVHVYAGVLSEYSFVAHEGLLGRDANARALVAVSRDRWLREYLPLVDRCVQGDFAASAPLAALLDNPFLGSPEREDVCDYFSWPVAPQLDAMLGRPHRGVTLTMLVAGLRYHAGDLEQAAVLWRKAQAGHAPPASAVGHFLDLAAMCGELPDAKRRFRAAFGSGQLERVEHALSLEALLRIPLSRGETELEQVWSRFRAQIYPGPGTWQARPFERDEGGDPHVDQ
jgi:hypothetical protein